MASTSNKRRKGEDGSPTPVLDEKEPRTIVTLIDLEEKSMRVVDEAARYAKKGIDAIIVAHFCKWVSPPCFAPSIVAASTGAIYENVNKELKKSAELVCSEYAGRLAEMGYSVSTVVGQGKQGVLANQDARSLCLEWLNAVEPDLVLVGCRDFGPVKRVFMGSFSRYIAQRCNANVMIVHLGAKAQERRMSASK